jgi:hypothetical protein
MLHGWRWHARLRDSPKKCAVTADDDRVIQIAEAIADGSPVHWPSEGDLETPELGDTLRELRVIEELAAVHRRVLDNSCASLGDVMSAARPQSPRPEGVPWGPLLVLDEVGGGSFGKVYRARDPVLDHEVALKRLRLPAHASSTQAASIVREGQLLARVRHQNVITVHGACEINGEIGIWMEFVRGKTLERLVQDEGQMSAQEASVVGESLCRALAAVHQAGVLHRDVKASNVMREAGGRIVMLDFGTGTEAELDGQGGPRRLAGTPLYMAPELFEAGLASVQSDLYSLGVLLFYLVTGTYPVQGKSLAEVRQAHQVGRRRLLSDERPDLPRNFVTVVERALCRSPEDRYQSAGAMLHDLSASEFPPPLVDHRARTLALVLLASATMGIWSMGLLASLGFNLTLSRVGGFGTEPLLSYWVLGFQSLIALSVYMLLAVLLVLVLRAVWLPLRRLAGVVSRRISWLESVRNKSAAYTSTMRRDASLLAQLLVLVEIAIVVLLCWRFSALLNAVMTTSIADAHAELLAPLRPASGLERGLFTASFAWTILGFTVAWASAFRDQHTSETKISNATATAGVGMILLLLLLFLLSYRTIYKNTFERVTFDSARCYVIGQQRSEVLLYCPDTNPPRNRVVNAEDPRLEPLHFVESIFTPPPNRAPQ